MSRQRRDLIILAVELVFGIALLVAGATAAWTAVGPIIKSQMSKSANSQ